jgi:hypothetical protein
MYSLVPFAPGVQSVRMKPSYYPTIDAFQNGDLIADRCGDTWFVFQTPSGLVQAIFYFKPNVHGWSASAAHAKSYVIRANPVDIAALDSIP